MGPRPQCYIRRPKVIGPLVPEKKIFERFLPWRPTWSCDPDAPNKFCSSNQWRLHMKFGFDWPSGLGEEDLWKWTDDNGRKTEHAYTTGCILFLHASYTDWVNLEYCSNFNGIIFPLATTEGHSGVSERWEYKHILSSPMKGFYYIWAWRPSWSCDPDVPNRLSFLYPWRISMKFGFHWPSGFGEEDLWKW